MDFSIRVNLKCGQMGRQTDGQQRVENLSPTPHLAKISVTKKVHDKNLL